MYVGWLGLYCRIELREKKAGQVVIAVHNREKN